MKKFLVLIRWFVVTGVCSFVVAPVFAQSYYDDDIYYQPNTKKNAKKNDAGNKNSNAYSSVSSQNVGDYAAADTYSLPVTSSLDVDVDSYNRRGQFLVQDSVQTDNSESNGGFAYTQRIERFHNTEVVYGSGDNELMEAYSYAIQQPTNVNIYLVNNDPWYWGYPGSWRFNNPWYWDTYYPYYGWGYNPYWSWSWGPSWAWGGWHPAPGPVWRPAHAWRPTTSSGSSRPHNYVSGNAISSHRPSGGSVGTSSSRPGNMGRGRYGNQTNNSGSNRVNSTGVSTTGNSNNGNSSVSRPGNSGRGRNSATQSNSNNYNTSNSRTYNSNNNNTNYRTPSSGSSFRPSGSGSRGYTGGGSTGGGSGRGRR